MTDHAGHDGYRRQQELYHEARGRRNSTERAEQNGHPFGSRDRSRARQVGRGSERDRRTPRDRRPWLQDAPSLEPWTSLESGRSIRN